MALIVVIEDNVQNARMVDKLLKRAGHTVLLAEDGELGLTTVFENKPDLVLIDLGLPDIDGQTVIGLIKQQPTLTNIVIIAFTAWPPEEAHDMATRYGCDGVITKPIQTRTFADEIAAFLPKAEDAPKADDAPKSDDAPKADDAPKSDDAPKAEDAPKADDPPEVAPKNE
ncbi:MAG: hypothetical protein Phog2KO_46260 [Phototrophicaceae bacterium]